MSKVISLLLSILYLCEVCESRHIEIAQIDSVTLKSCGLKSIDSIPPKSDTCFRWSKTIREKRILSDIFRGDYAIGGEFPYTVLIRNKRILSRGSCSGVVLNEQWIITAAHCIDGWLTREIRAYPGITKFPENLDDYSPVAKTFINPNFSAVVEAEKKFWDIALIKLLRKINRTMFKANGVCLPGTRFLILPDELSIFSGWGFLNDDEANEYALKKAVIKLNRQNTDERYFRVKAIVGAPFVCQGDSGGPLVQYVNGRAVLIGILRGVEPKDVRTCGRVTGMYFIQIPIHLKWITDTVLNN